MARANRTGRPIPSRRTRFARRSVLALVAALAGGAAPRSVAAEKDAVRGEVAVAGRTVVVDATFDGSPDGPRGAATVGLSSDVEHDLAPCLRAETAGASIGADRPLGATGCVNLLAPVLGCTALAAFEPRTSAAYEDYPANGEAEGLEYRSYLRAELVPIVQAAAERVRVLAHGWSSGHGAPIGLGDMSECDGSIPGTAVGAPAHPVGTHTGGLDIDIAYFQTGTPDNRLRPVCASSRDGVDQARCTGPPSLLDVPRTALFVEALAASGAVRVIGVDGRVGPLLEAGLRGLCAQGVTACGEVPLAYETADTGLGWFTGHHHHLHVSFLDQHDIGRA